jgi:uncharacterized protein (TIGR00730 family)
MRSICVYCGSAHGRREAYAEGARALGHALARRGLRLVYGGASVGLMGVVADAVLEAGGEVTGVIPETLMRKELAHSGLTELVVTRSMHERKMVMADRADGFVALPGGIGTFEELFEIWTWAQLGFHRKPCGILNVAGYYDQLLAFLDHARDEGLLAPSVRDVLQVASDPDTLLERFAVWQSPDVDRWLGRGEV